MFLIKRNTVRKDCLVKRDEVNSFSVFDIFYFWVDHCDQLHQLINIMFKFGNIGKRKDKDKKTSKSNSIDDYKAKKDKEKEMKSRKGDNKIKNRSKTNTSEIEKIANLKSKARAKSKTKSKSKSKSSHNSSSKKKKRSKTDASDLKHNEQKYELNDYISLTNKRKGLIRYIGTVHFGNGKWFGIELIDGSIGNHDGKVGKTRYFRTASKSAIFVTKDQIKKILKS